MTSENIDKCSARAAEMSTKMPKGERWSRAQVELLTELWRSKVSARDIAARTGRTERAVIVKASRVGLATRRFRNADNGRRYPKKARLRNCLRCGRQFFSEGVGNRICPKCKTDFSWRSGGDRVAATG